MSYSKIAQPPFANYKWLANSEAKALQTFNHVSDIELSSGL